MINTPPKFADDGYYQLKQAAKGLEIDVRTLEKRAFGDKLKYHITEDNTLSFQGCELKAYWKRYWTGLY